MGSRDQVLSANLNRLAKAKRVSRKDIAEATGLSTSMVGRLMRGEVSPEMGVVRQLAGMLGVKLQDLFAPAPQLRHIRFRSRKQRVNVRLEVLIATASWLGSFNELEDLLDDRVRLAVDLKRHGRESPEHAADRLRTQMDLEPDEPIFDICGLLESKGIKVCAQAKFSDAFFGLSVAADDGGPAVVVNCNPQISVERWIFSAAHELAHLVLHRGSYQADQQEEVDEEEREADVFAAQFLMPEQAFDPIWAASRGLHPVDRVIKAKRHFSVSYRTVLHRLVSTGRADQRVYPSFAKLYQRRTGKSLRGHHEMSPASPSAFSASLSSEPQHLSHADFQPERLSRLVREALDRGLISTGKAADILGISLSEMRELASAWVDDQVVA